MSMSTSLIMRNLHGRGYILPVLVSREMGCTLDNHGEYRYWHLQLLCHIEILDTELDTATATTLTAWQSFLFRHLIRLRTTQDRQ